MEKRLLWTATASPFDPSPPRSFHSSTYSPAAQLPSIELEENNELLHVTGINEVSASTVWQGKLTRFLRTGSIHEWFPREQLNFPPLPPHTILTFLAGEVANALHKEEAHTQQWNEKKKRTTPLLSKYLIWIGKDVWPSAFLLHHVMRSITPSWQHTLLPRCIFLAPSSDQEKFWAITTALSSIATAVVIASPPSLSFAQSVRCARASMKGGSLGLFVRTQKELATPSAATTRWEIHTVPSPSLSPRWQLELRHAKGPQPRRSSWIVEASYGEKISLHLPQKLVDAPRSEERVYQQNSEQRIEQRVG